MAFRVNVWAGRYLGTAIKEALKRGQARYANNIWHMSSPVFTHNYNLKALIDPSIESLWVQLPFEKADPEAYRINMNVCQ